MVSGQGRWVHAPAHALATWDSLAVGLKAGRVAGIPGEVTSRSAPKQAGGTSPGRSA